MHQGVADRRYQLRLKAEGNHEERVLRQPGRWRVVVTLVTATSVVATMGGQAAGASVPPSPPNTAGIPTIHNIRNLERRQPKALRQLERFLWEV